jgi:hypothetical protein
MGFGVQFYLRAAMRPLALFTLICLVAAAPSAADTPKKKKPDIPDDKLSCKQISGRMQVKIMQLRGFNQEKQSSGLSRGIQSGLAATFGNLNHGVDPQGDYAADIKKLHEFNQRLVDKGCKSYDVDAELAKKEIDDVPAPTVIPPKKPKKPTASSKP